MLLAFFILIGVVRYQRREAKNTFMESFKWYSYYVCIVWMVVITCNPISGSLNPITVKNCGRSIFNKSDQQRIIGGEPAVHGHYPWIVSIHEDDEGFKHACGGSILNENWILTAAHCIFFEGQPWRYKVLAGLHKQSEVNRPTVQRREVSKMILHKRYDAETLKNDIALLRLWRPIDFVKSKGYINGICLPKTREDPTGCATVIGWGWEQENGRISNTLRKVDVPIVPRDVCRKAYDRNPYEDNYEILDTMVCAGWENKDACQLDSGGPLFQTRNGISTQIGIVSFGEGCGKKCFPGVYTKVSSFLEWIVCKILIDEME